MEENLKYTVKELALENFSAIRLFQEFGVDFYCRGNLTLKESLATANVNQEEFLNRLSAIQKTATTKYEVEVENWPLDLLADYIQKTHHHFTDKILVQIKNAIKLYLEKDLPGKEIIQNLSIPLEMFAKEMGSHMKKEELILFPMIKKIVQTRGKIESDSARTVRSPVEKMIHEHDTQYQLLVEIREILNNYNLSESNTNDFKQIVSLMNSLDIDLGLHLHLENNILFPKAVDLERSKMDV